MHSIFYNKQRDKQRITIKNRRDLGKREYFTPSNPEWHKKRKKGLPFVSTSQ